MEDVRAVGVSRGEREAGGRARRISADHLAGAAARPAQVVDRPGAALHRRRWRRRRRDGCHIRALVDVVPAGIVEIGVAGVVGGFVGLVVWFVGWW